MGNSKKLIPLLDDHQVVELIFLITIFSFEYEISAPYFFKSIITGIHIGIRVILKLRLVRKAGQVGAIE